MSFPRLHFLILMMLIVMMTSASTSHEALTAFSYHKDPHVNQFFVNARNIIESEAKKRPRNERILGTKLEDTFVQFVNTSLHVINFVTDKFQDLDFERMSLRRIFNVEDEGRAVLLESVTTILLGKYKYLQP